MIPPEFTGGWLRVSIALDGGAPYEDMVVWWLQSASKHADLRVPLTPVGDGISFAGTTVWQEPSLTWLPDLELVPNEFPDTGVVSWDGDDLLEAGSFLEDGVEVRYVERWRRLPDTSGPLLALSSASGRLVRTGDLALSIVDARESGGEFNAVAWRLTAGAWSVDHCWPAQAAAPAPPLSAELTPGECIALDDGQTWMVDEIDEITRIAVPHGS